MTTTEMTDPAQDPPVPEGLTPAPGVDEGAGPSTRTEDFTVKLEEVFQGPLDLLLHLVKEQEVEIQEVRLA
ncbi:MAG: hypothetical protein ACPGPE_05195, partial [Planctomycetota bacterium]